MHSLNLHRSLLYVRRLCAQTFPPNSIETLRMKKLCICQAYKPGGRDLDVAIIMILLLSLQVLTIRHSNRILIFFVKCSRNDREIGAIKSILLAFKNAKTIRLHHISTWNPYHRSCALFSAEHPALHFLTSKWPRRKRTHFSLGIPGQRS